MRLEGAVSKLAPPGKSDEIVVYPRMHCHWTLVQLLDPGLAAPGGQVNFSDGYRFGDETPT